MPYSEFQNYIKAIPILRAQESLERITIVSYPHSKKESQAKVHKHYHKLANPDVWDAPKKAVSLSDLARIIANG